MAKKTRKELQNSFKQGAKPSGDDFKDLIDSTLNITDDGIEKASGTDPLKIKANGAEENLLDFYAGDTNTWRINQKPGNDKQGLNFSASGSSKLFIESSSGNVGISSNQPTAKLHVQQTNNEDALRVDDESGDNTPFIINKDGNVGIGIANPSEKLEIKLTGGDRQQTNFLSLFNDGAGAAQESRIVWKNGQEKKYAAAIASRPGSSYNAGDLRFQTASDGILKEQMIIANQGNVGIGTTSPAAKLAINGGLHVGGDSDPGDNNLLVDGDATITGVMSGAANAYQKAQFNMSGGGKVTWQGMGGRLKWTNRFIAISMERSTSFPAGHINIYLPTSDIPAAQVYDGKARPVTSDGVVLNEWEALYAVHNLGGDEKSVIFRVINYTNYFNAPSNWLLVAIVNRDDNTVKLGTGVTLSANSSSTNGSPIPCGTILMWSGQINNIPGGWALCDGQNGTPDLTDKFIVGAGKNYSPGNTGGEATVALTVDQMPSHQHSGNTSNNGDHTHDIYRNSNLLRYTWKDGDGNKTVTAGDDSDFNNAAALVAASNGAHNHSFTTISIGGNKAHENRPPYYALCFIMKL